NLQNEHPYYSYKFKRFLSDITLGMMPATVWKGKLDVSGGCLIVKDDGEVLCYHIYNRNDFENYLLNNTRFETASSTKYDFGYIYQEDERYFFKLNLQIRFLK
ncbi:MAG: HpaII family restriction endonuclease, partial [Candidatus Cloacimonetes bacterium]|nr:HpaII family restriction endonuclease [Candidatus Cloacimonadota bacterium]